MRARAALVALLVLAAACSDDGDDTGGTGGTGGTAAVETSAAATGPATTADVAPPTSGSAPSTGATAVTAAPTTPGATTSPPTTASRFTAGDAVLGDPVVEAGAPTNLVARPGSDTFYITGRGGMIWTWLPGADLAEALDMRAITEGGGEQGLLGLTFSLDGAMAYVDYTGADDGGNTHVDEYAVAPDGTIDPSSRRELLVIEQPFTNHNGGQLAVGPDGMLYIGMGDGGAAGDPDRRALDLGDLLGKILRIDPSGDPYTVPADNPFVDRDGARPEVWTYGLRNPWRFSFDPATGDLWIADVGQGSLEEIDLAPATAGRDAGKATNFGWSAFEGTERYNDDQDPGGAVPPIYEYSHDEGCSVSGGEVYRGTAIPSLVGWYVFADYCAGTVWALEVVRATDATDATASAGERIEIGSASDVSAVEVGPDGELYVVSLSGEIVPIVPG